MSSGLRRGWRARWIVAGLWLSVSVLVACDGAGSISPSPPVASVTIVGDTLLAVGSSVSLAAVARDAGGAPIAAPALTWSASDPSIATVSANGLVTGVQPGWAGVVVRSDQASDTFTLRVHVPFLASGSVVGWISGPEGLRTIEWQGQTGRRLLRTYAMLARFDW